MASSSSDCCARRRASSSSSPRAVAVAVAVARLEGPPAWPAAPLAASALAMRTTTPWYLRISFWSDGGAPEVAEEEVEEDGGGGVAPEAGAVVAVGFLPATVLRPRLLPRLRVVSS